MSPVVLWGGIGSCGLAVMLLVGIISFRAASAGRRNVDAAQQQSPFGAGPQPGLPPSSALSQFEDAAAAAAASDIPVSQGPKNPHAGVGFGSVAVFSDGTRRRRHQRDVYALLRDAPEDVRPESWRVTPDPAAGLFAQDLENPRPIRIPEGSGNVRDVLLPTVFSPIVAVGQNSAPRDLRQIWDLSQSRQIATIRGPEVAWRLEALSPDGMFYAPRQLKSNRSGVGRLSKGRVWIDIYDLAERRQTLQIRTRFDCDLLGISPDGGSVLLWTADESNRLEVYAVDDGRHVCSWQPFADEPDEEGRQLTGAAFLDAGRVATLNAAGRLVVWEVPAARALYAVENASQPALSPGGRYLAFADAENYHFLEAATGEVRGTLPGVGRVLAAGFHPHGRRLALLCEHQGGYYVIPIALDSGESATPIPVPSGGSAIHFCGENYVLLDNSRLIDLQHGAVAWSFFLGSGAHLPMSCDGRHWYVASSDNGSLMLAAVELPGPAAKRLAEAHLQSEYVLHPGGQVSLHFELASPPGRPDFQQQVRQKVVAALARNNIRVAEGRPVTLSVTMTLEVGESMELEVTDLVAPGRQRVSVPRKDLRVDAAYLYQGQRASETQLHSDNTFFAMKFLGEKTVHQALEEQLWEPVDAFFEGLVVPPFVFSPGSVHGLGQSTFTASGLE